MQGAQQKIPIKLTSIQSCNNAIRKLTFLMAFNEENKEKTIS